MKKIITIILTIIIITGCNCEKDRKILGFKGTGMKIDIIIENTTAEKLQLHKGDIILKVNNVKVENNKDLRQVLKYMNYGDKINVSYMRDSVEYTNYGMFGVKSQIKKDYIFKKSKWVKIIKKS